MLQGACCWVRRRPSVPAPWLSPSCLEATCTREPSQSSWGFVPMNHAVSSLSLYSLSLSVYFCCVTLTSPATLSPVWVLTSLHALAACDQAQLSVRLPSRGPWGAPLPRWPPRPSRTTASPGDHPTQGPRQQLAVVGAALGGLSGAVPWSPGSTRPHAPGPEGKKDGWGPKGWECCSVRAPLLSQKGLQRSGIPIS